MCYKYTINWFLNIFFPFAKWNDPQFRHPKNSNPITQSSFLPIHWNSLSGSRREEWIFTCSLFFSLDQYEIETKANLNEPVLHFFQDSLSSPSNECSTNWSLKPCVAKTVMSINSWISRNDNECDKRCWTLVMLLVIYYLFRIYPY